MDQEKIMKALYKFRDEVDKIFVGKTPKLTGKIDSIYDCDIYIFRHPGMGNSKQVISGNQISVCTATAGYLENLIKQGLCTENELRVIVDMAIAGAKGELKD